MKIRIDKLLSNLGYGTRSEVHKYIKNGYVLINGEILKDQGYRVDTEQDIIVFDDEIVEYQEYYYFMLNKPAGYITAVQGQEPVVMDLIEEKIKGLFPCGRLDKDTTGLLLITNDGPLTHQLLSPRYETEKEYVVNTRDRIDQDQVRRIEQGITLGDGTRYRPARVTDIQDDCCHITVTEGQYHEVKNMFLAVGNEVVQLKRIRMKNLILDESLAEGEYRPLSEEEVHSLKTYWKAGHQAG